MPNPVAATLPDANGQTCIGIAFLAEASSLVLDGNTVEMEKLPTCDLCGRPGKELQRETLGNPLNLEMDHDALWVCSEHRARLDGEPMGHAEEDKPVERISIVGEWDDGMAVRADALVFLDGNVQIWARA